MLMGKPNLYVLAGVNGAGKSSIGGDVLRMLGLDWYNPDALARALVEEFGMAQNEANSEAWKEGMHQLDAAIAGLLPFAFETTLGGNTVRQKLLSACKTHNVRIWYCGLRAPELHFARVQLRVSQGGHDIPREKIFERWNTSRANLVDLLPHLAELSVFDNSAEVAVGEPIPDPKRLLHFREGAVLYPSAVAELADTPEWAQAIVETALELDSRWQRR